MRTSNTVEKARLTKWAVFFIMGLLTLSACRKPDEDLGLNILPGDPLGVANGSLPLHAYTFEPAPIRTSGLTRNLLGSYLDPQFGSVKTGIVAQLLLSTVNVGQGPATEWEADSLVLSLVFDGANFGYGGLGAQRFQVFEVSEDLSADSLHYANEVPAYLPDDLVSVRGGRITPNPFSVVYAGSDTLPPQLRIRLTKELADRFMLAFNTPNLVSNASFLQFFRGLYITVDSGPQVPFQNAILYFNLVHAQSKAVLYYRDLSAGATRQYDFPINENSVRYTVVEFDRTKAYDQHLLQTLADTSSLASTVYVQSLGGLRTKISIPDISAYEDNRSVLAKAELIIPVQGTFNPILPPPGQLFLFRRDAEGEDIFLPDQLAGLGVIGGTYDATARSYSFNITRYVAGVLNGQIPNNGFELVAGSSGITANRVILSGPAAEEGGMRLLLTFTTY